MNVRIELEGNQQSQNTTCDKPATRYKQQHNVDGWSQTPHHRYVPSSLLIHTSGTSPFFLPHSPRAGAGSFGAGPGRAPSLVSLSFSSLSVGGSAACSRNNLCGDRCAYQTPALSPAPRRSYNYLLARFPQLSSNVEQNPIYWGVNISGKDATKGRSELNLLQPLRHQACLHPLSHDTLTV